MSPVEKLIRIINKDLYYSITDLHDKCIKAGFDITRIKLYRDIQNGRLESIQHGGKFCDHHILGTIFLDFFIPYMTNKIN